MAYVMGVTSARLPAQEASPGPFRELGKAVPDNHIDEFSSSPPKTQIRPFYGAFSMWSGTDPDPEKKISLRVIPRHLPIDKVGK